MTKIVSSEIFLSTLLKMLKLSKLSSVVIIECDFFSFYAFKFSLFLKVLLVIFFKSLFFWRAWGIVEETDSIGPKVNALVPSWLLSDGNKVPQRWGTIHVHATTWIQIQGSPPLLWWFSAYLWKNCLFLLVTVLISTWESS